MVPLALSLTVGGIDETEAEEHALDGGTAEGSNGEGQDKCAVAARVRNGRHAG